ncbi:hypothetical protein AVEN_119200-1 [Araneus ventricosus]|uniref:Uncharacterized protein n=1 Tax=Araneus ventricosus TaxID=182803 RepID=A0A4Y2K685_ARAVE|nr:hypothetical protein AVEN_119200-1 [Araneus ventricosus]
MSRLRGRKVSVSKLDSIEEPLCYPVFPCPSNRFGCYNVIGHGAAFCVSRSDACQIRRGEITSHWCGVETWKEGVASSGTIPII